MSKEITVQPATESDLHPIRRLLIELMDAIENTEGFDIEQSVKNCAALLDDPASFILTARDDNEILGFINFTARKTIMHPRPSALIDELVVTEASRGSGIGKRLILATIERCLEMGCCEVEVSTEKSNVRARDFYKSCGFEEDAVLLELDIED